MENPVNANSSKPAVPAVTGTHAGAGAGVLGQSPNFVGVEGLSGDPHNAGVMGTNSNGGWGVTGRSPHGVGVSGESVNLVGVSGVTNSANNAAVLGTNNGGGWGVTGRSGTGVGVSGESQSAVGVAGTTGAAHDAAVMGTNTGGGWGVTGRSDNVGVSGESVNGRGVSGTSVNDVGVHGAGKLLAGFFEGGVKITGELYVQGNVRLPVGSDLLMEGADCAERFATTAQDAGLEPGTVMVIADGGLLECSTRAYDRRVAGIVSGAGSFRPGIVLDSQRDPGAAVPVALIGKVYCKVDATDAPIGTGDLLTTSATPGHAMRATDPARAFGAILGKALAPLAEGRGLVPVLVTLQ
jgi:hypothetical protein